MSLQLITLLPPDITPAPLPISPAPKEHIDAILDEQIISTRDGGVQRFLVRWSGRPASNDTWITSDDLQQIDRDLFEYYQSRPASHSTESGFLSLGRVGEDTGSKASYYPCLYPQIQESVPSFEGRDPGLAAIVTLASSLDYTSSKSTLKLLLPLADPAQALNVPVVPLGALLAAAYPLSSRPPYVLSWLNQLISAEDMMHPELLRKLVLKQLLRGPAKIAVRMLLESERKLKCDVNMRVP
ncbi:alpha/beta hydrolase family protein [Actinidia rufa]|uniref:Alpha/beta hydrolase family protein n=1 Tax=Actinidia rufa TaxID=165716 RepID=A0A7J0DD70_9ERIC|nr:alpha/beta hydrolase family protein [Actinidia rufa]